MVQVSVSGIYLLFRVKRLSITNEDDGFEDGKGVQNDTLRTVAFTSPLLKHVDLPDGPRLRMELFYKAWGRCCDKMNVCIILIFESAVTASLTDDHDIHFRL